MYGVYMRWRMAKWVGQCAVMALMWPGSSTCSSATPLPLSYRERTLLGLWCRPSILKQARAFAWRAKVKLAFTTPSIVWLLVDNGGLVKPNLTFLEPPLQCATACAGRARDSSSVSRSSHLSQARLHHAGNDRVRGTPLSLPLSTCLDPQIATT